MKTTYIISTLFLSVLIWTCDLMGDVDKVKPYYKLEDQTAIRNAQSAEQVLRGVYTQWRAMSLCNFRSHIGLLAARYAVLSQRVVVDWQEKPVSPTTMYWKTIVSSEMSIIIYMM